MQKSKTIFFTSEGETDDFNASFPLEPWIRIYVDPASLRIRIDDYFGSAEEVVRLIYGFKPVWTEKIILKSRSVHIYEFQRLGFSIEAKVYRYFSGDDMYFMTAYPQKLRAISSENMVFKPSGADVARADLTSRYNPEIVKIAGKHDANELACLFQQVFPVYPTPITDASYISKLMDSDIIFMYIRSNGKIVSAASAEINFRYSNAELTDCASLPEAAGKGNMGCILLSLISFLKTRNISSIYSIARAQSAPMNRIFSGLGFDYTGCLINNVKISTGIENMFVWSIP